MPAPLLLTKLYVPPSRPEIVFRPRLIDVLNESMHFKLTLISTPAGFGEDYVGQRMNRGLQTTICVVVTAFTQRSTTN